MCGYPTLVLGVNDVVICYMCVYSIVHGDLCVTAAVRRSLYSKVSNICCHKHLHTTHIIPYTELLKEHSPAKWVASVNI